MSPLPRQLSISTSTKKGVSIFKRKWLPLHSWKPPSQKGGLSFRNFPKKEGLEFSHKKRVVGKIRGLVTLKKETSPTITLSKDILLSVCCVFLNFIISFSILLASQEGVSLVDSDQQKYDFCKSNFWKAKTLRTSVEQLFYINTLFIQCNTGSQCMHITGDLNPAGTTVTRLYDIGR